VDAARGSGRPWSKQLRLSVHSRLDWIANHSALVALVNQAFAKKFLTDASPLGHTVTIGRTFGGRIALPQVRLQALVIANAQTACEGRLIWSQATRQTLVEAGATPEMDDNISGLLRDIEGVQIAAFFKSFGEPDVTRLSMRCAAPYNAAEICKRVSNGKGGGHPRAAGATFFLPIGETINLVIPELMREMSDKS